ncbi:hypothetical protein JMG10_32305 [Nostoc ellipsosporum NOK]|nr:hypothetical protein [Nostoc ellipsosporum NOK]
MTGDPVPVSDAAQVRALLIDAAREHRAVSYSELLALLGHRFTRPLMRALCKTLDAIDDAAARNGEPELAVLVVRESDAMPGQGWWVSPRGSLAAYDGPWEGPAARALVEGLQREAFDHWSRA